MITMITDKNGEGYEIRVLHFVIEEKLLFAINIHRIW